MKPQVTTIISGAVNALWEQGYEATEVDIDEGLVRSDSPAGSFRVQLTVSPRPENAAKMVDPEQPAY